MTNSKIQIYLSICIDRPNDSEWESIEQNKKSRLCNLNNSIKAKKIEMQDNKKYATYEYSQFVWLD